MHNSLFLLQAYMREHECTLTTENSVVTVTPATKECINAGNLTTRGCSDLMPSSASSNLQGPSSSRRKRGAGGQGPPPSGSSSNYKNWKAINSSIFQTTEVQEALGRHLSQSTLRTFSSTTTWTWMNQTDRRLVISLQTSSRLAPSGAKTAHLLSEFLLMKL